MREVNHMLDQRPPHLVNVATRQNESATSTGTSSLAGMSKLYIEGNGSPKKKKKMMMHLFQSVLDMAPDEKMVDIATPATLLMSDEDPTPKPNSTDWRFGISPPDALDAFSQFFFVPEGDLVDQNESEDFVPKAHITNYHNPRHGYLMLQRCSNFTPKEHNAFLASMYNLSLLPENPSKTASAPSDVVMLENSDNTSSRKEDDNDDEDKDMNLGVEANGSEEMEEIKKAIASLAENLRNEINKCVYEQSELSYVLIPISVCKYYDLHNCTSHYRTSCILP
jgi:hypothetical protein